MNKYSLSIFPVLIIFFLLTCTSPQNPFSQDKAKVFLHLESSANIASDSTITDTTWNSVRIGISYFMPEYFDSVIITVEKNIQNVDTFFVCRKADIKDDTVWFEHIFKSEGTRTVTVTGYTDGGYKPPVTATITILPKPINHKPYLIITGKKSITAAEACTLFVSVNDSDTVQAHTYQVLNGPIGYTFANQIFTWKPASPADTGIDSISFKVADNGVPAMSDTQTVLLTVKTIPQIIDSTKPIIIFSDPVKDSVSINSNSYSVKVVSKDASGVGLVMFTLGTTNFVATKSADTIWSTTVTGLASGAFNKNTVVATDASVNSNKDTLIFYIKYDSTMTDLTGPVFFQKSGPADNTVVTVPNIVMIDSIVDPSGVDTVSWTLNGVSGGVIKPDSANHYMLNTQLITYHGNKIIIAAYDKSSNHNKSADTIMLDYNVPPVANDRTLSTKKDTPLSIALTANSVDGDPLSGWIIVAQPKNGALSGTAPTLTYTSATGFIGLDSLLFTVSDGINTSLPAKIWINVSDVLVAPKISNQLSDTAVNQGTKATFSVITNPGANPTPSFSWKKEGQTSVICSTQTFTINQTKYSDESKYRCVVSNSQGTDSTAWVTLTVRDVTKPVIILKGANPQNIILGSPYVELGDSAYDDRDGIITSKVVRDTTKVNTALAGTYKVTYSVKDSTSNFADTATRSVVINGIAPTITNISGNQKICVGVQATFSVTASGTPVPRYQWMKGTAAAPGTSTNGTYQITPGSVADAGNFYCVVSNGISPDAQTQNMTLTVDSPPVISMPNHDTTIIKLVGDSIKMTATASGSDTLHYQWYKGNTALGTGSSLMIKPITFNDSGPYSCSVTNSCKTANSSIFTLVVNSFPSISTQPLSQTLDLGQPATFSVVATGKPAPNFTWRKNGAVINGATSASYTIPSPGISDSGKYTVTVTNSAGSLISDTARFYAIIKSLAAGGNQSLFLKTDGRLFACGANSNGQLGNGSTNNDSFPRQIMTDVQAIAAGAAHSLILKTNGTLFACGYNTFGQLGDGTTSDQHSPEQIMTGVQAIAAGGYHSLILMINGTLFACGANSFGQLGDSTTNEQHSPVQIMTGVQAIAAGDVHSFILKTNGTLFACGYNGNGQLGSGSTNNDSFPRQITTDVQAIGAGAAHSLILKTNGTLFACGFNGNGQLGDGTTSDQHSPEQIMTGVQAIATGGYHSLILMINGTLFACGDNSKGQLGDGTSISKHLPVQIFF